MDLNSVPRQNKHNQPDYTDKRLVLFIETIDVYERIIQNT
jgi:hypothetical protein